MRLLILSLNGDPSQELGSAHAGGQCKYILELGKNLLAKGWDIDVLTIAQPNQPRLHSITEGFDVHRLPRPTGRAYGYDITRDELHRMARESGVDGLQLSSYSLVLCCYWLSALYLVEIDSTATVPRVVTFCSLAYFKARTHGFERVQERLDAERYIAREFDHVIATNSEERRVLIDAYDCQESKIHLIPRGVDLELFGEYSEPPVHRPADFGQGPT